MNGRIILAAAVAATLGCGHGKDAAREDDGEQRQEKKSPAKSAPTKEEKKEKEEEAAARPPAEEGRPELTTSAEGLLLDDGPRLIQEALAERGYLPKEHRTGELDAETSAALRKFQADEELARTGYPDRETVRQLGLPIAEVFKATGAGNKDPERKQ